MELAGNIQTLQNGINLWSSTMYQHESHAKAVQQGNVLNQGIKIRMQQSVAIKHDDEGLASVRIDVR